MKVSKTITGTFGLRQSGEKEMFGTISLPFPITPDHIAGRLLSRNVSGGQILVRPRNSEKNIVYEALIKFLENEEVIVTLSSQFCSMFQLSDGSEFDVDVQFQINRQALCEMHDAIDRLGNHHIQHILFPTACETNTRGKVVSCLCFIFFKIVFISFDIDRNHSSTSLYRLCNSCSI